VSNSPRYLFNFTCPKSTPIKQGKTTCAWKTRELFYLIFFDNFQKQNLL
jgi:hypothetical protein